MPFCWKVTNSVSSEVDGIGTRASHDIAAGEVVDYWLSMKETFANLVHISEALQLSKENQDYFFNETAAIGEGYLVGPKEKMHMQILVKDHYAMNHSCDPNLWFEAPHLVAKRDIKAGEEFSMDYCVFSCYDAAYMGLRQFEFSCKCNAPNCRKEIRLDDLETNKHLQEVYSEHLWAYKRKHVFKDCSSEYELFTRANNGEFLLGTMSHKHLNYLLVRLAVPQCVHEYAVYAWSDIKKGAVLAILNEQELEQLKNGTHKENLPKYAVFSLRKSESPTAMLLPNSGVLVATKDLETLEEVTINF